MRAFRCNCVLYGLLVGRSWGGGDGRSVLLVSEIEFSEHGCSQCGNPVAQRQTEPVRLTTSILRIGRINVCRWSSKCKRRESVRMMEELEEYELVIFAMSGAMVKGKTNER